MIKEIVQFTKTIADDPELNNYNLTLKEGLHLIFSVQNAEERISIEPIFVESFNKKMMVEGMFEKCAAWMQNAWMTEPNKCFDPSSKAFHTCSPFCFGLKRESLEAIADQNAWQKRLEYYFLKASQLIDSNEYKSISNALFDLLKDLSKFKILIERQPQFRTLKGEDYIVVYLDLEVETYTTAYLKYLKDKLFNTSDFNIKDSKDSTLLYGTSNWFNKFPNKKPFLKHHSATFNISGRISSEEALLLEQFSKFSLRKFFPKPLPIFIMEDERMRIYKILKNDLKNGGEVRAGYFEILKTILEDGKDINKSEVGNYYLIFQEGGEIKDFDFVGKFEFYLRPDRNPLEIVNLFKTKETISLDTVVDFMHIVLPPMFSNALIAKSKSSSTIYHWFDELNPKFSSYSACLLALKYRKAFYDFIYKSQRQNVTGKVIEEILITGILDHIRLDKWDGNFHSERLNIATKLNLLFSLYNFFSTQLNPRFMAENIQSLRNHIDAVARGQAHLENDEQFAFAAGQVVDRISSVSISGDRSFGYLEPFLAQTNADRLKLAIANYFKRYKHGIYSQRFEKVSAAVLAYPKTGNVRELLPIFLAGVFSDNLLYSNPKPDESAVQESENQ